MTDAHPQTAKTIRIGRQPDDDIALTGDLDVSRHHAELRRNPDGSFEVIDLGTDNGTYVNGKRIASKNAGGAGHDQHRPRLVPAQQRRTAPVRGRGRHDDR